MKAGHKDRLSKYFPINDDVMNRLSKNVMIKEMPARTVLLSEGDVATKLFLVMKGCLRAYFIKESGIEVTSQFFVEGQMVASFESAMTGSPSRLCIDTIEDSTLGIIQIKILEKMINESNFVSSLNRFGVIVI